MKNLRCITVRQPWAELIASGEKLVENRRWHCAYRGELYIHAGKYAFARAQPEELRRWGSPLPRGVLVARVNLIDIVDVCRIYAGDEALERQYPWLKEHRYVEGPWCWLFAPGEVQRLPNIEVTGQQGLWSLARSEVFPEGEIAYERSEG